VDDFDGLIAEAVAVPLGGWDFSWLAGRATEQRPSWGYARLVGERMAAATAALDVQTGGGEVLATVPRPPALLVATESWPPNVAVAARNLKPFGASVVAAADAPALPFPAATFDLVVSRHPVRTWWDEIARVLMPGGTYLSQQVGAGSNRELSEAMMGPLPPPEQHPDRVAAAAEAAGLRVIDLRAETLRAEFFDVGAVAYFLRKVIWTVPDFTIERYERQLRAVHGRIRADGVFVSHPKRLLIEAVKAGGRGRG
jgi:SAM-dependent methyltransferase